MSAAASVCSGLQGLRLLTWLDEEPVCGKQFIKAEYAEYFFHPNSGRISSDFTDWCPTCLILWGVLRVFY